MYWVFYTDIFFCVQRRKPMKPSYFITSVMVLSLCQFTEKSSGLLNGSMRLSTESGLIFVIQKVESTEKSASTEAHSFTNFTTNLFFNNCLNNSLHLCCSEYLGTQCFFSLHTINRQKCLKLHEKKKELLPQISFIYFKLIFLTIFEVCYIGDELAKSYIENS